VLEFGLVELCRYGLANCTIFVLSSVRILVRGSELRLVFMGSPEFAVPPLEQLLLNGHEIAAVYTRPDKPAGRGRLPVAPPIKETALSWNLPVVQETTLKQPEAVEALARLCPEAIVVAAFGQLLPPAVLEIPCYGCLNIHPSLLPRYRGASPVAASILAGDEFAGVSVMRLDAGMDTGPIFSRAQIPILPWDTTGPLTARLFEIGARMLTEVLAQIPGGGLVPEPQDPALASYTREIAKEDGRIDWNLPALDIWRRVRAYQPWPEAYTFWKGKQLKIVEAVPLSVPGSPEAGRVVTMLPTAGPGNAAFGVGTGSGILGVLRVQAEGKRAMEAGEFLRGQKDILGAKLGE
jgi:methionyl-tRNA formyltransferase